MQIEYFWKLETANARLIYEQAAGHQDGKGFSRAKCARQIANDSSQTLFLQWIHRIAAGGKILLLAIFL
jgi:hypothetical protein